jgi:membrane protein implicated in regulation of membrane protease activity
MQLKSTEVIKTLERLVRSTQVATVLSRLFVTTVFVLILPVSAIAYVGPGAGIALFWALWAVIVAFVFMVGGLLVWPFRAFLRRWKKSKPKNAPALEPAKANDDVERNIFSDQQP